MRRPIPAPKGAGIRSRRPQTGGQDRNGAGFARPRARARIGCRGRRGVHSPRRAIGGETPDLNRALRHDGRGRGGGRPSIRAAASRPGPRSGRLSRRPRRFDPVGRPRPRLLDYDSVDRPLPIRMKNPTGGVIHVLTSMQAKLRSAIVTTRRARDGWRLQPRASGGPRAGRCRRLALGRTRLRRPVPLTLGDPAPDGAAASSPPHRPAAGYYPARTDRDTPRRMARRPAPNPFPTRWCIGTTKARAHALQHLARNRVDRDAAT